MMRSSICMLRPDRHRVHAAVANPTGASTRSRSPAPPRAAGRSRAPPARPAASGQRFHPLSPYSSRPGGLRRLVESSRTNVYEYDERVRTVHNFRRRRAHGGEPLHIVLADAQQVLRARRRRSGWSDGAGARPGARLAVRALAPRCSPGPGSAGPRRSGRVGTRSAARMSAGCHGTAGRVDGLAGLRRIGIDEVAYPFSAVNYPDSIAASRRLRPNRNQWRCSR